MENTTKAVFAGTFLKALANKNLKQHTKINQVS